MTVRALGNGEVIKRFTLPINLESRFIRWTPDGQALAYIVSEKGAANLWMQSLSGAPPRQLTNFKTSQMSSFAWSPDGKWLAFIRNSATSDVVLLRDFK
jgi:Tol biopolymer transport system component